MKIEINKGCTDESVYIDGKWLDEENIYAPSVAITILQEIIKKDPISILKTIASAYGEEEWDEESCEQCGHTGSKITYEIE